MPIPLCLFPLNTVLFPGGLLPLRIFEARYVDMVSRCMRTESPFVVALLSAGEEVGEAAEHQNVGVTASIFDFEALPGGLLGITARGLEKVRVLSTEIESNQLIQAVVEPLRPELVVALDERFMPMSAMLDQMLRGIPFKYEPQHIHLNDAGWVSNRLTELLPFVHEFKQSMLEERDPEVRCERLWAELNALKLL